MYQPWLSICVPTCNRPDIIVQLIDSINEQNVDKTLYEVCISDNSTNDDTCVLVEEISKGFSNIRYQKSDCKGFLNSVEALKMGSGKYLKLHNDYSIFQKDSIVRIIDAIIYAEKSHTYIYFSLGILNKNTILGPFYSFNEFAYCISYFATWSSSFGIWKEEFDGIISDGIVPNYMYPHTSFLHKLTNEKRYFVDDSPYAHSITPKKKGGYNLVDNFVRIYLSMVKEELLDKSIINLKTYYRIQYGVLRFCADWFYATKDDPEKFTFLFDDDELIVLRTCGQAALWIYRFDKVKSKLRHDIKKLKQ